jgi:hypothetical protein
VHTFSREGPGATQGCLTPLPFQKKKKKKVLREIHRLWWRQMCAQTRQGSEPRAEVLGFATLVNPL